MEDTLHLILFPMKHAKKIYYLGILLLILLFPLVAIFLLYTSFPFSVTIFLFCYLAISIFIIFSGSAYVNLKRIHEFVKERYSMTAFNLFTYQLKVRDDTNKEYLIAYHVSCSPYSIWVYLRHFIFFTWDIPPEHYHVWTDIPDASLLVRKNRYAFFDYIRPSGLYRIFSMTKSASQGEFVFNNEVSRVAPQLHPRAKDISTLRVIGLAEEGGNPIILALATQQASPSDIAKILDLLKDISAEFKK
jgi:hypothetical protein